MEIVYKFDVVPAADAIIELYNNAGLPRPTDDPEKIDKMYKNSNLIVTAWHNDLLVGVSRAITDWAWSCYLADLAVRQGYQKEGIGKKLIDHTKEKIGEETMLLLLSVPSAMTYYPRVGFSKEDRSFAIHRTK